MSVFKDSYSKFLENKGQSGYGAAILVSQQGDVEGAYSLLVASETVPSIFGTSDSFEFDLLNSPTKGKVMGKMTLDDKEVEVLHHRDNVLRFKRLKDKILNFMVVDSQFVGYKFVGKLSYRMNDATADVLRGTYTITPMSADPNPILDARKYCKETLCFASVIPDEMTAGDTLSLSVVQQEEITTTITFSEAQLDEMGNVKTGTSKEITGGLFAPVSPGLYEIGVTADGYADWSTTVYVNPKQP
jgi:hypothetical protein